MKNGKNRVSRKSSVIKSQVKEVSDEEIKNRRNRTTITSQVKEVSDEEIKGWKKQKRRRPVLWPTREQFWQWMPFVGVILLGVILRFWGLGDKPLHHDESLHAYFSLQLMHNLENWQSCFNHTISCYKYDPLLHGPFQFHAIAFMYKISQLLGAPDNGVNTTTVRLAAAISGSVIVALPYLLRDYMGRSTAWFACFLLAISPSLVYYSRFAREDIYMACFTFLLVVAIGRYIRDRKGVWLVVAALAFALSYATKEATFLSMAVFGSFFGALLVWEIGVRIPLRTRFRSRSGYVRYLPKTGAPLALIGFALLCAPLAKWFFGWIKNLSTYITNNTATSDVFVQHLKNQTLAILPWGCAIFGVYVLFIIVYTRVRKLPVSRRSGIAAHIDPVRQPVLDTLAMMPWTHWFCAILAGSTAFVFLFTVLLTNYPSGIGDGIWQGLYYWLEQQLVARGGQPWYYYLMLLPLYEQIGLIFGIVGIVRCLWQPTRFRMFIVYWFLGNLFIYSWAGEKMPWLTIHITMPMMVLAALGLDPVVMRVVNWVKGRWISARRADYRVQSVKMPDTWANGGAIFGVCIAIVLIGLTLQNMFQLTYVHYADAPHEMMIYVQTTTDVDIVMNKVEALDQQLYGGKHLLNIGVVPDADWPFYWYLRDYTNVCYGFPSCGKANPEVIITGGDNIPKYQSQYAVYTVKGGAPAYLFHQYRLRSWWDEGYKPAPCVQSAINTCAGQPTWGGVGPFRWLSYGDNPPAHAQFDPGLALIHVWQWWWERRAIGSADGTTNMGLFIRSDLGMKP